MKAPTSSGWSVVLSFGDFNTCYWTSPESGDVFVVLVEDARTKKKTLNPSARSYCAGTPELKALQEGLAWLLDGVV